MRSFVVMAFLKSVITERSGCIGESVHVLSLRP